MGKITQVEAAAVKEIARLERAQVHHRAADARRVINDLRCGLIAALDSYRRRLGAERTAARYRDADAARPAWASRVNGVQIAAAERSAARELDAARLGKIVAAAERTREIWAEVAS